MKELKSSLKTKSSYSPEPIDIQASLAAGKQSLAKKDYYNAKQHFQRVLSADPQNAEALEGKVTALRAMADQAQREQDKVLTEHYLEEAHATCLEDKGLHTALAKARYQHAPRLSTINVFPVPEQKVQRVDNLVFQGGGIKGLAYPEAMRELATYLDLNQVKRFAGTSAGAMQACILALGYTLDECDRITAEVDFPSFMDGEFREQLLELVRNSEGVKIWAGEVKQNAQKVVATKQHPSQGSAGLSGLFAAKRHPYAQALQEGFKLLSGEELGLFPGDTLRENALEKYIQRKTGIAYATFRDLHDLRVGDPDFSYLREMYFIGVNLNTKASRVFSYETSPDVIISDAVRISMSIPLLFHPHKVHIKTADGQRVPEEPSHNYVDGGLLDNYPLWVFDYARYVLPDCTEDRVLTNPYSLGLRLLNTQQVTAYQNGESPLISPSEGLGGFLWHLVETIYQKQNSDHLHRLENQRTIYIDHLGISAIAFDLSEEMKIRLRQQGRKAVEEFFHPAKQAQINESMLRAIRSGDTQQVIHLFESGLALPDTNQISGLEIAFRQPNWAMVLTLVKLGAKNCTEPEAVCLKLEEAARSPWVDTKGLPEAILAFKERHGLIETASVTSAAVSVVGI